MIIYNTKVSSLRENIYALTIFYCLPGTSLCFISTSAVFAEIETCWKFFNKGFNVAIYILVEDSHSVWINVEFELGSVPPNKPFCKLGTSFHHTTNKASSCYTSQFPTP